MTVTATIAGAISMLANFAMFTGGGNRDNGGIGTIGAIALMILGPLAAGLVQMAISRTREYEADRGGAEISGQPLSLASALQKIAGAAHRIPNMAAERNPASAHMFIINPLSGFRVDKLFSTHPAVEDRVARLEALSKAMGATGGSMAAEPAGPWSDSRTRASRGPWAKPVGTRGASASPAKAMTMTASKPAPKAPRVPCRGRAIIKWDCPQGARPPICWTPFCRKNSRSTTCSGVRRTVVICSIFPRGIVLWRAQLWGHHCAGAGSSMRC